MIRYVLPIIVVAQFCCTSVWFAGNAVLDDLVRAFGLPATALGHLTSVIQLGFICGTLFFALLAVADRYSPSRVFMVSALAAAVCNLGATWAGHTLASLLGVRFLTGFFLAGIYPVGMKIAADYYEKGLGKSLGYLVGALVMGTAFPHLLKGLGGQLPWRFIFYLTSVAAAGGATLVGLLVADGPYRKPAVQLRLGAILEVFGPRDFRRAAFGYFGHMWELYTFWALLPLLVVVISDVHPEAAWSPSLVTFGVIAAGGVGCVLGGYVAERYGSMGTARAALLASGLCCLALPLALAWLPPGLFLAYLLGWGVVVAADSPQFSTLVAQRAEPSQKGSALTLVNCLGFAITIVSIQLLAGVDLRYVYPLLAVGPLLGVWATRGG
ncbi:MFS transporter [Neolewinella lacunae]|uniref:MFS transporter n=1 Tax=Neolewinella lacunae TaxID=1517758 RepID=UPI0025B4D2A7|nr:MFS transporter [Neolewinella lacunae]MDN3633394.1 MFS transporter [Neolewinella lacunae]